MKITIINRQRLYKINTTLLKRICRSVADLENSLSPSGAGDLKTLKYPQSCEFVIFIIDDCQMTEINRAAFSKSMPTDVIAYGYFETLETVSIAAEIFVNAERAFKAHKRYKTSVDYEFILYAVHGILHIFGYDDIDPCERKIMKKRERYYMNMLFSEL